MSPIPSGAGICKASFTPSPLSIALTGTPQLWPMTCKRTIVAAYTFWNCNIILHSSITRNFSDIAPIKVHDVHLLDNYEHSLKYCRHPFTPFLPLSQRRILSSPLWCVITFIRAERQRSSQGVLYHSWSLPGSLSVRILARLPYFSIWCALSLSLVWPQGETIFGAVTCLQDLTKR